MTETHIALDSTTCVCTGALTIFVRELVFDELPADVVVKAKEHLPGALGITVASTTQPFGEGIVTTAYPWGGVDERTQLSLGNRLPRLSAAMVNGMLIHGLDYDDAHMRPLVHVSAMTLPAAVAVGEARLRS